MTSCESEWNKPSPGGFGHGIHHSDSKQIGTPSNLPQGYLLLWNAQRAASEPLRSLKNRYTPSFQPLATFWLLGPHLRRTWREAANYKAETHHRARWKLDDTQTPCLSAQAWMVTWEAAPQDRNSCGSKKQVTEFQDHRLEATSLVERTVFDNRKARRDEIRK